MGEEEEGQAKVQATHRQKMQEASAVEGVAGGGASLTEKQGGGEVAVLWQAVDGAPGKATGPVFASLDQIETGGDEHRALATPGAGLVGNAATDAYAVGDAQGLTLVGADEEAFGHGCRLRMEGIGLLQFGQQADAVALVQDPQHRGITVDELWWQAAIGAFAHGEHTRQ